MIINGFPHVWFLQLALEIYGVISSLCEESEWPSNFSLSNVIQQLGKEFESKTHSYLL